MDVDFILFMQTEIVIHILFLHIDEPYMIAHSLSDIRNHLVWNEMSHVIFHGQAFVMCALFMEYKYAGLYIL